MAEEAEAAIGHELISSECSAGSTSDDFPIDFLAWLGDKPVARNVLFGRGVACVDELFFAVLGGCRNGIVRLSGREGLELEKRRV